MKATIRPHAVAAVVAIVLAATSGCNNSPSFSHVGGGGAAASDGWWFSAGSIYLEPNEPGVLFGMKKTPDGNREFAYFVIFRHDVGDDGANVWRRKGAGVSFDGELASMTDGITINGNGIQLNLELQPDKQAGTINTTKLTVDGNDIDPTKGTLFLVDLTSSPVTHKQVVAKFPVDLPALKDTATVKRLAREVTQQLKSENESVKEFLGR